MLNESIIWPSAGSYVVAVSGGADSVALLRLMHEAAGERGYDLVVAHFDHAMRKSSHADAQFVAALCTRLKMPFKTTRSASRLASEAAARAARYDWLRSVKAAVGARGILTAHHQDDLIETSLLNVARGSGWRGIAPFRAQGVVRPLTAVTRTQLRGYLADVGQDFVEDPTNQDLANPRNLLRHRLLASASEDWRKRYLELVGQIGVCGDQLDTFAGGFWHEEPAGHTASANVVFEGERSVLVRLGLEATGSFIVEAADRMCPGRQLRRRTVDEAALFVMTGRDGQARDLGSGMAISIKALMVRISFGFSTLSGSK